LAVVFGHFDRHLRDSTGVWSFYDPNRVEAAQRNRPVIGGTHRAVTEGQVSSPVAGRLSLAEREQRAAVLGRARAGFEQWGTFDAETMRLLACDGPRMVCWIGAFQHERFDRSQASLFRALARPLQRRFALEERLGAGGAPAALLPALLEEIAGAAYLLDAKHRVVAMNSSGSTSLAKDRERPQRLRQSALGGTRPDVVLVDLASRGVPGHSLLIERSVPAPVRELAVALQGRYGLTPREVDVLVQLGRGMTNRAIGVAIGCGERTVETHVRRILEKTDRASRSELVALLWSMGSR
jgi:DNA-binding CsgD family transcriptional regulator